MENSCLIFQRPELSYAVTKAYFDKNMSDQKSSYTFDGSYYYKTVKESDLSLEFSDADDGELNLF